MMMAESSIIPDPTLTALFAIGAIVMRGKKKKKFHNRSWMHRE
jgi:hypothetical protein